MAGSQPEEKAPMTFGGGFGSWPNRRPGSKQKGTRPSIKPKASEPAPKVKPIVKAVTRTAPKPPGRSVFDSLKPRAEKARVTRPSPVQPKPQQRPAPNIRRNEPVSANPGPWRPPAKPTPPPIPSVSFSGRSGIAIIGQFEPWKWGQHPDEAYLADALEVMGTPVYRIPEKDADAPLMQAEWALFTGVSAKKLDRWSATHKTMVWTLDWLPDHPERRYVIDAGRRANLFVTSDRYDWWTHAGISQHFYLPGACESLATPFDPKPYRPVAFVGTLYNERRRRIAELVRSLGGQVLDAPGSWVYSAKLAKFCQETKIIIGDNIVNNCPGYWSSRNYVIPGAGGFLLTPLVPELDEQFELGKTIAVYPNLGELKRTVEYYLKNDAERERIRKRGFDHVRGAHNWGERAVKLLDRIGIKAK